MKIFINVPECNFISMLINDNHLSNINIILASRLLTHFVTEGELHINKAKKKLIYMLL